MNYFDPLAAGVNKAALVFPKKRLVKLKQFEELFVFSVKCLLKRKRATGQPADSVFAFSFKNENKLNN